MPSLWKRENSPFWVCCYSSADGQRCKKSTKITIKPLQGEMRPDGKPKTVADKEREAKEFCAGIERAERFGKNGTLTEQTAKKIIGEILERTTGETLHNYTAGAWLDEWLAGKDGVSTVRTLLKYRQIIGEFKKHLGERAGFNLTAIAPRDLRSFRDSLAKAGHSPATVNGALKIVASPFNAAQRLGYIAVNPCASVEALRDDADTEKDVFTSKQVRVLIDAAEGDWKGAILAGYCTGLRLRDVVDLKWEALDFDTGLLRVKTGKTGTVVVLPLHAEFSGWLKKQPRGIGKASVFPSLTGKSGGGKSGLSMAFKRIMAKAKIVGRILRDRKEDSAGRTQSSLSFHSLRHSFNSAMANAGVSQEIRQKLTGHASAKMNAKYTHHELQPLRAAIALLPSVASK